MAQGTGYNNTAPTPLPGSSNPTGVLNLGLPGVPSLQGSLPPTAGSITPTNNNGIFPSAIPLTGSSTGTTANAAPFAANGAGTFNPANFNGLFSPNSGIAGVAGLTPAQQSDLYKEFERAYGRGTAQVLTSLVTNGVFTGADVAGILNALQPGINRGEADINSAFGGAGARFSSAAGIGLGDYLSQVNLNEGQIISNLDITNKQDQLSLLQNTLPTLHTEQANANSSGILGDILGGLEIAGGIALTVATGGAAAPIGIGLASQGANTIAGANGINTGGGGGGGGVTNAAALQNQISQLSTPIIQNALNPQGVTPNPNQPTGGYFNSNGQYQLTYDTQQNSAANAVDSLQNNNNPSTTGSSQTIAQYLQQLGIDPSQLSQLGLAY